ncbi:MULTISPECIES: DUF3574 domain-containing protein [Rhodoplanes]|uniref:DUF3574 domain-containing protein n=1 Tax=Rhodoplanes TaxID=29407 RepID=UPI0013EA7908|nr:DUF3574 domain-containing protein [Rhodoplanes serenus]
MTATTEGRAEPVLPAALAGAAECAAGAVAAVVTELYLGRSRGGRRVVSDAAWERFLAREITPRFPDGLTVLDGRGQWRDGAARVVREATKVVVLVTPATGGDRATAGASREARVAAIVDAYKRRFDQRSVLVLTRMACAQF